MGLRKDYHSKYNATLGRYKSVFSDRDLTNPLRNDIWPSVEFSGAKDLRDSMRNFFSCSKHRVYNLFPASVFGAISWGLGGVYVPIPYADYILGVSVFSCYMWLIWDNSAVDDRKEFLTDNLSGDKAYMEQDLRPAYVHSIIHSGENRNLKYTLHLVREYRRFMYLISLGGGEQLQENRVSFVPSVAVDSMWHAHITHTKLYNEYCHAVAGRFIHHRPSPSSKGVVAVKRAGRRQEAIGYNYTLHRYKEVFDEYPPPLIWPRVRIPKLSEADTAALAVQRNELENRNVHGHASCAHIYGHSIGSNNSSDTSSESSSTKDPASDVASLENFGDYAPSEANLNDGFEIPAFKDDFGDFEVTEFENPGHVGDVSECSTLCTGVTDTDAGGSGDSCSSCASCGGD